MQHRRECYIRGWRLFQGAKIAPPADSREAPRPEPLEGGLGPAGLNSNGNTIGPLAFAPQNRWVIIASSKPGPALDSTSLQVNQKALGNKSGAEEDLPSLDDTLDYIVRTINATPAWAGYHDQINRCRARRVANYVEITETIKATDSPIDSVSTMIYVVDFQQLDPWVSVIKEELACVVKATATDCKAVITCEDSYDSNRTHIKHSDPVSSVIIHLKYEADARRVANAFKRAIKLSGGKASAPPKVDPFDN